MHPAKSPDFKPASVNVGYKLVFDNVDKTVKPRYMRMDTQSQCLHHVQAFAVRDRVDYSCQTDRRGDNEINL